MQHISLSIGPYLHLLQGSPIGCFLCEVLHLVSFELSCAEYYNTSSVSGNSYFISENLHRARERPKCSVCSYCINQLYEVLDRRILHQNANALEDLPIDTTLTGNQTQVASSHCPLIAPSIVRAPTLYGSHALI